MKDDEDIVPIRRPPETIATVGGLIDETRLTIGVHGEDLDPDEVSRILGCMPSRSHRRGEPRPGNVPCWPKGAWLLSVEGKAPVGPEDLLSSLLERLPSDPLVWENLRHRYSVRLGFGLFRGAWNRGFELSPSALARVVSLGFGLEFDIYADTRRTEGRPMNADLEGTKEMFAKMVGGPPSILTTGAPIARLRSWETRSFTSRSLARIPPR